MKRAKAALRKIRDSQPLNYMAVSTLRATTAALGAQSEFLIRHFPKVGVVRSRLPNGRILSLCGRADDFVSNQIYWRGWRGYEPEMGSLFFQFASKARIIFDVGAHVGFYALVAGHANASAKVFAFEPAPVTFERLELNISLNCLSNITCVQCAVGNSDGVVPFYKGVQKIPCSAGTSLEFYEPWASEISMIRVKSLTGDRFLEERGLAGIDLVKIDTETTEPEVLRGMVNSIKRDCPAIFCEVLAGFSTDRQIEDLLKPLGYRFYMLTTTGPIARDHIVSDTGWPNYLLSVLGNHEINDLYNKQVGSQRV